MNNVPAHARAEELERLVTPLGTLVKCEKIGSASGASASPEEDGSSPQPACQTFELVYETAEEAEKCVNRSTMSLLVRLETAFKVERTIAFHRPVDRSRRAASFGR